MTKTYGMKEHTETVMAVMARYGFTTEITLKGNILVTKPQRELQVMASEVMWVIRKEELPIHSSQVRPFGLARGATIRL